MIQRLTPHRGGLDKNFQVFYDLFLASEIGKLNGPKLPLNFLINWSIITVLHSFTQSLKKPGFTSRSILALLPQAGGISSLTRITLKLILREFNPKRPTQTKVHASAQSFARFFTSFRSHSTYSSVSSSDRKKGLKENGQPRLY